MSSSLVVKCEPAGNGWRFTTRYGGREHESHLGIDSIPPGKARDLLGVDTEFFMAWYKRHTVHTAHGCVSVRIPLPYTGTLIHVALEPHGDETTALHKRIDALESRLAAVETPYRTYRPIMSSDDFGITNDQLMRFSDLCRPDWTAFLSTQINTSRSDAFEKWLQTAIGVRTQYLARVRNLSIWAPHSVDDTRGYYSTGCWATTRVEYPGERALGPFTHETSGGQYWLGVELLDPIDPDTCASIEGKK